MRVLLSFGCNWKNKLKTVSTRGNCSLHVSHCLTAVSKYASLPLHSDLNQLIANDFGKFFRDKINSIRLEIACQGSTSDVSESHFALDGPSFSEFRLLSETEVHELIKSSTKTTCSLDPIRTKLFTECLDVLPSNNNNLILILRAFHKWSSAHYMISVYNDLIQGI